MHWFWSVIESETIAVLANDPINNNATYNNTTNSGNNITDNNLTKPVDKSSSNNENKTRTTITIRKEI